VRWSIVGLVLAAVVGVTLSACGERSAPVASPSPKPETLVGKKYRFAVSYDPRYFVVDDTSNRRETLFVAKPRWPGQPEHFEASDIVWVNCIYIDASDSPGFHGAPCLRTKKDVRRWEASVRRWEAAHRVVINNLVGTKGDPEVGLEGSSESETMPARSIVWELREGDVYFHVQVDCPTKYWPVWGPRMLAVVNSLRAVE
jgi:hypothetical protein